MAPYLVLLLAVLSRILPHAFHSTGMNFTAVGGGLLFFGSRLRREDRPEERRGGGSWQIALAMLAMMATDFYLTVYAYGYDFHARHYIVTWAWYGAVCLLGSRLLSRRQSVLRAAAAVLASATSFFVLSNFAIWAAGTMYPRTAAGLLTCYAAALPFYANDLASTAVTVGALFGLPVLAARLVSAIRGTGFDPRPLA